MDGGVVAGGAGGAGGAAESPEALLTRLERAVAAGQLVHSREEGLALHAIAVRAARGRGPQELALGEGLDVLARRHLLPRLGRSGVGDVGREDLGLRDVYARRLRRNAEKLRVRPHLRAAVAAGEVTSRKAEVVLDRTAAKDDAYWTARAKSETVRGLEAATKDGAVEDEEAFHTVFVSLPCPQQDVVWTALDFARLLEGGATGRMRQVEVISWEYLSGFPCPVEVEEASSAGKSPGMAPVPKGDGEGEAASGDAADEGEAAEWGQAANEDEAPDEGDTDDEDEAPDEGDTDDEGDAADEDEAMEWGEAVEWGEATGEAAGEGEAEAAEGTSAARPEDDWPIDAKAILARLKALVAERASVDETLRRACLLVKALRAYRWLDFTSFEAWCSEALGLNPRTVRHWLWLERRLQALPPLRQAVRDGTLTLEKAREVAGRATPADVGRRIAEAAGQPVFDTLLHGDGEEVRRMRDAGVLRLAFSGRAHRAFLQALATARYHGHGRTAGEALMCMSAHFILTWREEVTRGLKQAGPAMRRDDWRCQVPGCSRGAEHLHHITWRSRGGDNHPGNLISLCAAHHQQGVHQGHLVISGEAPDAVVFEVGGEVLVRGRLEPPGRRVA